MNTTAQNSDIQIPSRKYPLDAPTNQAISALMPTPRNPASAGRTESRRTRRHSRIATATPSAEKIAGSKPKAVEIGTRTATGNAE